MNAPKPVTLRKYYASFKSIPGAVVGLSVAAPALSRALLPSRYQAYAFPPLGNADGPARVGTLVLVLAATYFAFFAGAPSQEGNRKRVAFAVPLALIWLCLYVGLFSRFVRVIEIHNPDHTVTPVSVSVGYERTEFARANFGGASDWELLRYRGVNDGQIYKLWTTASVLIARLSLFISYVLFVFTLVAALGWGLLAGLTRTPAPECRVTQPPGAPALRATAEPPQLR